LSAAGSLEAGVAEKRTDRMVITGTVELEVRDASGTLLEKHSQPMHTFVMNFMQLLYGILAAQYEDDTTNTGASASVTDMNGTSQGATISFHYTPSTAATNIFVFPMAATAASGDSAYGILVGSGSGSYSPNDTGLASLIPGTTLSYGAVSVDKPTDTGSALQIVITRTFSNNSGSDVTVTEVGLVGVHYLKITSSSGVLIREGPFYVLLAHDFLSSPITVPNGATLTVRYIINVSYK